MHLLGSETTCRCGKVIHIEEMVEVALYLKKGGNDQVVAHNQENKRKMSTVPSVQVC